MAKKRNVAKEPARNPKRLDRPGEFRNIPHTRTVEEIKTNRWILDKFSKLMGRGSMFWEHPGEGLGSSAARGASYFDLIDVAARIPCIDAYSKENYRFGKWLEGLALREQNRGRKETAMNYYYRATLMYLDSIWCIFDSNNEEIKSIRRRINACYERICEFASYPMERIEIPFEGKSMPAYFHMTPAREKAPTIIFVGGMDQWKEMFVNPCDNNYVKRGLNLLALDGPGQGESLEREIFHDTPDKFGKAGKAAIDWLINRKEVDAEKIGVYGNSMGTYWAPLIVLEDSRVKAAALAMSCYNPADGELLNEDSPNFRARWMWMSNKSTDEEFDDFFSKMTFVGKEHLIKCPLLMFAGELDHLGDVWTAYNFWKKTNSEIKELRIYYNQYHSLRRFVDEIVINMSPDWLRERLLDKPVEPPRQKVLFVDNWKNERSVNVEALEKGFSYIESE